MDGKSNADRWRERIRARRELDAREGIVRPQAGPVPEITMLTVNSIPRMVLTELNELAFKSGTSASALGLLAIEQLLDRARISALSLPPKSERQVN